MVLAVLCGTTNSGAQTANCYNNAEAAWITHGSAPYCVANRPVSVPPR